MAGESYFVSTSKTPSQHTAFADEWRTNDSGLRVEVWGWLQAGQIGVELSGTF